MQILDTIELFNKHRPNDININIAISDTKGEMEYFKFTELHPNGGGSGNSLSQEVRAKYENQGFSTTVTKIKTDSLINIYQQNLPNKYVDFLNVDVEGFDLEVLHSNNWEIFRPRVIAVEIWSKDIDVDHPNNNDTYHFLRSKGYIPFSCAIFSWFFYDSHNPLTL